MFVEDPFEETLVFLFGFVVCMIIMGILLWFSPGENVFDSRGYGMGVCSTLGLEFDSWDDDFVVCSKPLIEKENIAVYDSRLGKWVKEGGLRK